MTGRTQEEEDPIFYYHPHKWCQGEQFGSQESRQRLRIIRNGLWARMDDETKWALKELEKWIRDVTYGEVRRGGRMARKMMMWKCDWMPESYRHRLMSDVAKGLPVRLGGKVVGTTVGASYVEGTLAIFFEEEDDGIHPGDNMSGEE